MLVDAFASDWLDELDRLASDSSDARLMLDGAFCPGLHRAIRACLRSDASVGFLFESLPSCNDESRDVSPFVFSHEPGNLSLARQLARCNGWPMVHCIRTQESPASLAARLGAWCAVDADGQRFNLRFPDTRRLQGICAWLADRQRRDMFGPATRWSYVGRDGRWADLNIGCAGPGLVEGPASNHFGCPQLDASQFASMVDDGEVDALMFVLQERGTDWLGRHSQVYGVVESALALARRAGLDSSSTGEWCEACVEHPSWVAEAPASLKRWESQQSESVIASAS